jgi:DNA-binding MarR family transcriptional regulator
VSDSPEDHVLTLSKDLRVVIGALTRRLRELARSGDLTWSQRSVLIRLENGPATVTALARAENVRTQSMGATIATLEAAGLIKGEPDPADARQTILSLTPACRQLITDTRAAREDWLFHAIQNKLAPAEREKLAAAIEILNRLTLP